MNTLAVIAALLSLCGQPTAVEAPPESTDAGVQYERWMDFYQREAQKIQIFFDDAEKTQLTFQPRPVLKWTNPTRANQIHGAVFIWSHGGRAEVMGSIWSNVTMIHPDKRTVGMQFHSLSTKPLVAERNGARFWYPRKRGIEPQPIPDAPPPAAKGPLRLSQMRKLASNFSGEGTEYDVVREIRLLSQPIYRQETSTAEAIDGALFILAMGTDPEVLVLIEARQTHDGPRWHFSAGRFTGMQVDLRYRDEIVWKYRGPAQQFDPREPYLSMYDVMRLDQEIHDQSSNGN